MCVFKEMIPYTEHDFYHCVLSLPVISQVCDHLIVLLYKKKQFHISQLPVCYYLFTVL